MKNLISHLVGDYLLQSHWMAVNKAKSNKAAAAHAVMYTLAFLPQRPTLPAMIGIAGTHYLIDRYRLAKYPVYAKNLLFSPDGHEEIRELIEDRRIPYVEGTGMPPGTPEGLANGLFIAADNTLHLALNEFFLRDRT